MRKSTEAVGDLFSKPSDEDLSEVIAIGRFVKTVDEVLEETTVDVSTDIQNLEDQFFVLLLT